MRRILPRTALARPDSAPLFSARLENSVRAFLLKNYLGKRQRSLWIVGHFGIQQQLFDVLLRGMPIVRGFVFAAPAFITREHLQDTVSTTESLTL